MMIEELCRSAPVIPALVVPEAEVAADLAGALSRGGLVALEVTLRTPTALDAIAAMVAAGTEAVIGVGTLLSGDDVRAAHEAGAAFGVSPGLTEDVHQAAQSVGMPLLPGVATPSEAMRAADMGYHIQKFFPADANGGAPVLKAWTGPLPHIRFCPTGGVSAANAHEYLSLPNVICVGGSWPAPKDLLAAHDWTAIEAIAREAAALGG